MTYIEFFDKTSVENICACLTNVPDRVVILGDKFNTLKKHAEIYDKVLKARGYTVEFICKTIERNKLEDIVRKLSDIVETYDDCHMGLTGGEDLALVAAGIVFEKYKDKNLQMHRFNIRNNTIFDCDQDGRTIELHAPELSVEENIEIYGGAIVYEDLKPKGTYVWDIDDEFFDEVNSMWDICKNDVKLWNMQLKVFEAAEGFRDKNEDILTTVAPADAVKNNVEAGGGRFIMDESIIRGLYNAGLLREFKYDGEFILIRYKNMQMKKCLIKAGLALELKMFVTALSLREDGRPVYNDVMNGVYIDWDGEINTAKKSYDTENEIDVIMMKGMVPVFVSCKNGKIEMEELYKLNSVAQKFGDEYVKKVLIAEALDPNSSTAKHFRQRAADMGIKLIENIHAMSQAELEKTVKLLWKN